MSIAPENSPGKQEERETQSSTLSELLAHDVAATPRLEGVVIGKVKACEDGASPMVEFPGSTRGLPAVATVQVTPQDVGRDVALGFENGDALRPIILGFLIQPESKREATSANVVRVDGNRTVVTGEQEIELRCGNASITLTRAGKILIRGAYVLSRSSGVNSIKGGSVQIN